MVDKLNLKIDFNSCIPLRIAGGDEVMQRARRCAHRRLVCGSHFQVEQCAHGTVHLTVGDVTLRMSPSMFQALAATLQEATLQVEGWDAERPRLLS